MIQQTWQVFRDDMLAGAPKWLDDDRWDIVAKPPANAVVNQPGSTRTQVDFDTVLVMLKALLAERFKLATHVEDREMNAYSLVAVKPKMKQVSRTRTAARGLRKVRRRWTRKIPGTQAPYWAD